MNEKISFQDIDSIPQLIKDFLSGKREDCRNFNFSVQNIERVIFKKKDFFDSGKRQILLEVLTNQYQGYSLSDGQKENLEKIALENTFTVTTGHQLNLFTGPVFFIYKIIQTIKTCEYLKDKFPDCHFVPLFWMASEDHDFEEINHFQTDNAYYGTSEKSGNAVGKIVVEDTRFVVQFNDDIKGYAYSEQLSEYLSAAYPKGETLAFAIRTLSQRLFAEHGLLVLDGDDSLLKSQMTTVFEDELTNHRLFTCSANTVERLRENYGKVQVNPREINLFYLSDTRNRIERGAGGFEVVDKNQSFSTQELLQELNTHPERFSPNALMRPVYQETVLPNIAYIGGNAEVMYWLELGDYFDYLGLPFPILIPRNSFAFVPEKLFSKVEKLGLSLTDFYNNYRDKLNLRLVEQHTIQTLLFEKEQVVREAFEVIKAKASFTEKTFVNLVEAESVRQLKSYAKMKKRLLKAERRKHYEAFERAERIAEILSPNEKWQERQYNFSVFFRDFGFDWLNECYELINVEKPMMIVSSI